MADHFDDASRRKWHRDSTPTMEDLQFGCLQRIATATELMAKNHDQLVRDRDSANRSRDYWRDRAEHERRSAIALRGQVTKLKKRLSAAKENPDG